MNTIQIECRLTEQQYRDYMKFHVLGNKTDVRRHVILSVLILLFGFINFRAGSPILGWIFVTLGVYVFVSRFVRFYMSVNRIVEQYGLSGEPKFFYALTFDPGEDIFRVRNVSQKAEYPLEKIFHIYYREKQQMLYLYLTKATAFLLPESGFTGGSVQELLSYLQEKCGEEKISRFQA